MIEDRCVSFSIFIDRLFLTATDKGIFLPKKNVFSDISRASSRTDIELTMTKCFCDQLNFVKLWSSWGHHVSLNTATDNHQKSCCLINLRSDESTVNWKLTPQRTKPFPSLWVDCSVVWVRFLIRKVPGSILAWAIYPWPMGWVS